MLLALTRLVAISESQELQHPISNIEEDDKLLVGLEWKYSDTSEFETTMVLDSWSTIDDRVVESLSSKSDSDVASISLDVVPGFTESSANKNSIPFSPYDHEGDLSPFTFGNVQEEDHMFPSKVIGSVVSGEVLYVGLSGVSVDNMVGLTMFPTRFFRG